MKQMTWFAGLGFACMATVGVWNACSPLAAAELIEGSTKDDGAPTRGSRAASSPSDETRLDLGVLRCSHNERNPPQFTASAFGDLDCDGVYSTFVRFGVVEDLEVRGSAGLYIVNELE